MNNIKWLTIEEIRELFPDPKEPIVIGADMILEDGTMIEFKTRPKKQLVYLGHYGCNIPIIQPSLVYEELQIMKHGLPQGRHKKGRQTQWRNK